MGLAYAPARRGIRLWSAALRGQTASLLPEGQYAPLPRYVLVLLRAYARFVDCEQREDLHK